MKKKSVSSNLLFGRWSSVRSGFTYVELMVVLSLLGIVMVVSLSIFSATLSAQQSSYNEYDLQNKLRQMSANVESIINKASALFTIPAGSFREDNLSAQWDYYGVSQDGKELVSYVYDSATKTHKKTVLVKGDNITFQLEFYKPYDSVTYQDIGEKFVGYKIKIFKDGVFTGYDVDTYVEAKNSKQVVHRGDNITPATAIAVRSRTKVSEKKVVAFVHMIFDLSGSMAWDLDGNKYAPLDKRRITLLKKAAKEIVEAYSAEQDIELVFYPFSRLANTKGGNHAPNGDEVAVLGTTDIPGRPDTYTGHTIYTNNAALYGLPNNKRYISEPITDTPGINKLTDIKPMGGAQNVIAHFDADGGTNLTDAMRRAYYQIDHINRDYVGRFYPGYDVSHYLIILVDGAPGCCVMLQKHMTGIYDVFTNYTMGGTNPDLKYFDHNGNYWCSKGGSRRTLDGMYYRHPYNNGSVNYGIDLNNDTVVEKTIEHYGGMIATNPTVKKSYVIGFSRVPKELIGVDFIAASCGVTDFATQVIKFDSNENLDLTEVFFKIKTQIMDDIWFIKGPKL